MKKILMASLVAAVVLAAGLLWFKAQAASIKYSFIARGVITDVDEGSKTIKVDVTKAEGRGKDDMEGENIEMITNKAKVYKVVNAKDKRVTYHTLAMGQEIGIKGVANSDDTFTLSFIRINERKFSVVGLLQEHTKGTKTFKISVISSTFKPATYKKGTEVTMTYTDNATFYAKPNSKEELAPNDLSADAQRVKLTGTIENSNDWKVTSLWNNYKASK